MELNKVGLQDFYSRRGAPGVLTSGCKAQERRAKEIADNRANAFDYRNIKFGSNACINDSDIIKKDAKENILVIMIDELNTYSLSFNFLISTSRFFKFPNDINDLKKLIWRILSNVCAVVFLDLKTPFLHHQAAFTC